MIIGLDIGGTHADAVLMGNKGLIRDVKVPTDPDDLFHTVLTGLKKITEGIDPKEIERTVLSTTLTTNAIVQNKTESVGMIVSGGPGLDPEFYRTNPNYYVVSGSIDHRGREIEPIDRYEIQQIADKLKEEGIRYVGVVCKFSVRNPNHEMTIYNILKPSFDKIFLGHQVSGNLNFPRRIATTYLNAAVYRIHKKFFEAVQQSLEKHGLKVPIHVLKADGGTMSLESSMDFPGQTILSGPAASVMGSLAFAPGDTDCLVLDIGGTTTDMAILIDGAPLLNPLGITLGHYKTLIRSLETYSVGIGGDSALRMENGRLGIGPDRIGPAMAYGGSHPTPTDALFVLNLIDNGDREKSVQGLTPIANDLNMSVEDAASHIFDAVCQNILSEAEQMVERINSKPVYTIYELMEGHRVKPKSILVLGGPAPYFAKRLGELSDYSVSTVKEWAVANAIGAALARTTCEVTLFADTQQEIATAPEEGFSQPVDKNFSKEKAIEKAFELLRAKAISKGADKNDLELEILEELQFNMVQGFYTTGRNIRVKVQVKPGLIRGYVPKTKKTS